MSRLIHIHDTTIPNHNQVVLACKQGRQWALALDLLREMRQVSRESGIQVGTGTDERCRDVGWMDIVAWLVFLPLFRHTQSFSPNQPTN